MLGKFVITLVPNDEGKAQGNNLRMKKKNRLIPVAFTFLLTLLISYFFFDDTFCCFKNLKFIVFAQIIITAICFCSGAIFAVASKYKAQVMLYAKRIFVNLKISSFIN